MAEGGGKSDIEAGRAFVTLLMKDAGFSKGITAAGKQFQHVGKGIAIVGAAISAVGASITAPLLEMVREFTHAGDELYNMSRRTNKSVEDLQVLGYAASKTGTDMEKVQQAIFKAQKSGKSFDALAAEVAAIQDPAKQSQKAIELFGKKAGPFIVPMIRDLARLRAEFKALGLGMSGQDAKSAHELEDSYIDLKSVITQVRNVIGATLAPVVKQAVKWMTDMAVTVGRWVKANRELFVSALKIGFLITGVGTAIVTLGGIISGAGFALIGINGVLGLMASLLGALLSPIGLVVSAVAALATWFATSTTWGRQMVQSLTGWFGNLLSIAKDTFGGISDAIAAGDLSLAANVLWSGLKLAWLKGTESLRAAWAKFAADHMAILTNLGNGIQGAWDVIAFGIKSTWAGLVAQSKTIGEQIGHALSRKGDVESVEELQAKITSLKRVMAENKSGADLGLLQAANLADLEKRLKEAKILGVQGQKDLQAEQDKAHEQALKHITEEHLAEQKNISNDLKAKLAAIEARKAVNGDGAAAIKLATAATTKAQAELDALRAKAAKERKDKELAGVPKFNPANIPTTDMIKDQVFGSYSAAALEGGGGGPPDAATVKELREAKGIWLANLKEVSETRRLLLHFGLQG